MKSIIVYSGKGGVGKTTTTANIAKTFVEQGKKVYIIDGDINTPSMGVIFKNEHPSENLWVASTSFSSKGMIFVEKSIVRAFLRKAIKEINEFKPDYLLIDTPPSITDVHINLIETLEISNIIIVTQPNELSRTDVNRTAIFFTDRCKDAGCCIIENMVNDNSLKEEYSWPLIAKIPFQPDFNGEKVLKLNKEKYKNICQYLEDSNTKQVILEARKKMMFDETIQFDDLPYGEYGMKPKDIKFVNINTWDDVKDRLLDLSLVYDKGLSNMTTENIGRLIKAFESDEEAYFMVTRAPNTAIDLIPGEIGKCSMKVHELYYGVPCVVYQTKHGEVTLFPYEVTPADFNEIQMALNDGYIITSDNRYIPPKDSVEQCYNAFGSRIGLTDNWEEKYERVLKGIQRPDSENINYKLKVATEKIKKRKDSYNILTKQKS